MKKEGKALTVVPAKARVAAKETFDLIVIGAGSGLRVSSAAADAGLSVAVIEQGPFGGTCLNRGCIPSKMYIHVADVIQSIQDAAKLGIRAKVEGVDWNAIVKRVIGTIDTDAKDIERGNKDARNITVVKGTARFAGPKTLAVGRRRLTARHIVIAAGTRPSIPPIPGLDKVRYITSDEVLRLKKQPKSMIFIGGGYIACELAHFFSTLGTKVTVLQRSGVLLGREDREIATAFTQAFMRRVPVLLNTATLSVSKKGGLFAVRIETGGKRRTIRAETLVVATGRRPNTDILEAHRTAAKMDKNGHLVVDGTMRTTMEGIWALGDIAGRWFFKHSANIEADYCAHNIINPNKPLAVDYKAMPHAVFSSPQVAGVGATEEELVEKGTPFIKGTYAYKDTGYGAALMEEDGFVKVLVDPASRRILGCHILGPDASILIHEVVVAMRAGMTADMLAATVHVHPALNEVVQRAFAVMRLRSGHARCRPSCRRTS